MLSLTEEKRQNIRQFLRGQFSGKTKGGVCFFRRFSELKKTTPPNIEMVRLYKDPMNYEMVKLAEQSFETINQYVDLCCENFTGVTCPNPMRSDEPIQVKGKKIYLRSQNYGFLDTVSSFEMKYEKGDSITPKVVNGVGDLIFIFMKNETLEKYTSTSDNDTHKKVYYPPADLWTIVSEQFFHAYIAIVNDWDDSYNKLVKNTPLEEREALLKKKIMKGSYLRTNSLKNEKLCRLHLKSEPLSIEEHYKRFWYLRTEPASKSWCDVYICLVLIARFGELPDATNEPVFNGKNSREWDLPERLISNLFAKTCEENSEPHFYKGPGIIHISSDVNLSSPKRKNESVKYSSMVKGESSKKVTPTVSNNANKVINIKLDLTSLPFDAKEININVVGTKTDISASSNDKMSVQQVCFNTPW